MSVFLFKRLFERANPEEAMVPLYRQIVECARQPLWYADAGVPDTINGRFDMVASIMALVLIRLERESGFEKDSVHLTELFVRDMDGQLRLVGVGDYIVGKHMGRLVGALGGRLGAYRTALVEGGTGEQGLTEVIRRNLYADVAVSDAELAVAESALTRHWDALNAAEGKAIVAGKAAW